MRKLLILVCLVLLVACRPEQPPQPEHTHEHTTEAKAYDAETKGDDAYVSRALPPSKQTGFDSSCSNAWVEASDRIVFFGQPPPVGHLHRGFGTVVEHDSSLPEMHLSETNCNRPEDTAGYWIPALLRQAGGEIRLIGFKAYYRTDVPVSDLKPMPENLKMIAGDKDSQTPQNKQVTSWNCKKVGGGMDGPFTEPTNCADEDWKPRVKITFPQCLAVTKQDPGRPQVDSENHKVHLAYPPENGLGSLQVSFDPSLPGH